MLLDRFGGVRVALFSLIGQGVGLTQIGLASDGVWATIAGAAIGGAGFSRARRIAMVLRGIHRLTDGGA